MKPKHFNQLKKSLREAVEITKGKRKPSRVFKVDLSSMKSKSIQALIFRTSGKTFRAYQNEMRRHERALGRIYAGDKQHKHVPQEVGAVNQVWPEKRHVVTFYRCELCLKDLTAKEVKALQK